MIEQFSFDRWLHSLNVWKQDYSMHMHTLLINAFNLKNLVSIFQHHKNNVTQTLNIDVESGRKPDSTFNWMDSLQNYKAACLPSSRSCYCVPPCPLYCEPNKAFYYQGRLILWDVTPRWNVSSLTPTSHVYQTLSGKVYAFKMKQMAWLLHVPL